MNPTLHFDSETIPADAFAAGVGRAASALQACGIGESDVFAVMLYNEPAVLELMFAGRALGARWCLVNWHFKTAELRHVLSDSGAKLLIVHANLIEAIAEAIPAGLRVFVVTPSPHTCAAYGLAGPWPGAGQLERWEAFRDLPRPAAAQRSPGSAIVYTSGTTGRSKGIRRESPSAEQLPAMLGMYSDAFGFAPGMRALLSAPLYHSAPMGYALYSLLSGAELWLEPRFDAERTLQLIASQRISHMYLVTTMAARLLALPEAVRARHDVSSLKFVGSTGSPFPAELKERMIKWWGPLIHEAYAASELGYITQIDSREALRKPGSAGRVLPGATLKVISDEGVELPAGAIGTLYARNPAVPDFTYLNNDAARRALDRDGLWTMGDVGYVDADGYLYICDRKADMVISGGVNIYPAEIEAVLISLPGVADCAVFGIPDEEFGESLAAAVQITPGASLSEAQVRDFLRERIAGYKLPRSVSFHAELPREDSGKIFKRKLRDPYWVGRTRRV